jgi:hypothetical protein
MQHISIRKSQPARPIALVLDGEPKGVLIHDPQGYRFMAVKLDAFGVDGQVFESVEAATEAVRAAAQAA